MSDNPITTWLWQVAVKKAVSRGVQLVIAFLSAKGLDSLGVKIDEAQLTLAIFAGIEFLRNWLKIKLPKQFGWL